MHAMVPEVEKKIEHIKQQLESAQLCIPTSGPDSMSADFHTLFDGSCRLLDRCKYDD